MAKLDSEVRNEGFVCQAACSAGLILIFKQEFQELAQRLKDIFMPTEQLIARFYDLEEKSACMLTSVAWCFRFKVHHISSIVQRGVSEGRDLACGRMEAMLTYDSSRDTISVFCMYRVFRWL